MPIKHNEKTKEKARFYYLNGESYSFIKRSLKEEYGVNVAKSTLSNWKKRNGWEVSKKKIREEVTKDTERKATDSIGRRLKVLDIKPDEYIRIIREAERLQDALNAKELLVKLVSEKLPFAMKEAGLTQKQINAVIRTWIEETREV